MFTSLYMQASSLELQPKPCTPIKSSKTCTIPFLYCMQSLINLGISESLENGVEGFKTLLDCGNYDELYATSIRNANFFWGTLAKQFLQWDKPFEKVEDCNMEKGEIK
jgi:hypothetical protein